MALGFAVEIDLDLDQIARDLTLLMVEVDRIEAIAAGKTLVDADETHGQATDKGRKGHEGRNAGIQKGRAAQRQGRPRGNESTTGNRYCPEQKGQGV